MSHGTSLSCCADLFIERISDPLRRGRRVAFVDENPGFENDGWHRGAYNATMPQGARGLKTALNEQAKREVFERLAGYQQALTEICDEAAFDEWLGAEIDQIGGLASSLSGNTYWSYGRSQKLINVFLKYAASAYHSTRDEFNDFRVNFSWIGEITGLLHAPIDRNTMKWLVKRADDKAFGTPGRLQSWWKKGCLTQEGYQRAQALLKEAANKSGVSRIHYEMIHIW